MTPEQFSALAKLLRSLPGPAQDAARLVLVDGLRPSDAARQAGASPASVSSACRRFRDGLELARVAAGAFLPHEIPPKNADSRASG